MKSKVKRLVVLTGVLLHSLNVTVAADAGSRNQELAEWARFQAQYPVLRALEPKFLQTIGEREELGRKEGLLNVPTSPVLKWWAFDDTTTDAQIKEMVDALSAVGLDDHLVSITLHEGPITDAAMSDLRRLRNLQMLFMRDPDVTEIGLGVLPEFPALSNFFFMSDDLSPGMVEQIAKSATIQHLYLEGRRYDSSGTRSTIRPEIVKPLQQMKNLRKLDLDGRAEREALEAIAGITSLKSLEFDGMVTSGEDLQALATMPRLRELDMGYLRTPEEDAYQNVHGARAYRDLTDATMPSVDLSPLKEVRSLRKLVMPSMRDNRLEQAGIDQLDQVTAVVTKADYDSGNLEPFAAMPNLRSLRLERVKRLQETLAIVKEFGQLERLSIGGLHFKDAESDAAGLLYLNEMPNLRELELNAPLSLTSPQSRRTLSELTNLKKLTVYCRGEVPPEHQAILDELKANNPDVKIVVK